MLFYTLTYKRQVLEIEIQFLTLGEIQYMLTSEKMIKQSLLKRRKEVDAYSLTYDSGGDTPYLC